MKGKFSKLYIVEGCYPRSRTWTPYPDTYGTPAEAQRGLREKAKETGQKLRVAIYWRTELLDEKGNAVSFIQCEECGAEGGKSLPQGWSQCGTSKLPQTKIASYCPKCATTPPNEGE